MEKTVEFSTGQLTIKAGLNGEPIAIPLEIYNPEGGKVSKNWTNSNVKGQWTILLSAGTYKVKVLSIRDKDHVVMFDAVQIMNGLSCSPCFQNGRSLSRTLHPEREPST